MKKILSSLTLSVLVAGGGALRAQKAAEVNGEPASVVSAAEKGGRSPAQRDEAMAQFFTVNEIKGPQGVDPQVGGIAGLPDGRMAVAFHHGEIAIFDSKKGEWSIFAEGLHEPLGILPEPDGSLLVMQRPELTRLRDTTGDGRADSFQTVWDGFGMTGNYHEFSFGPLQGPGGKVYVALNLASAGAPIRPEIRGKWLPIGLERKEFNPDWKKTPPESWKKASKLAGRMYSRVPWRGWLMEVDTGTGKAVPFASGFRSPDGLGWDAEGNLMVSDNQGDWRGSSELFVVAKGGFYGHPASLPWRADWGDTPPLDVTIERLEQLRTPAAVWFPHGTYANSPTQMVVIPKTAAWGPYGGQVVIGEMNVPRLLRVTVQKVGGVWQGACYPFVETKALHEGLHRLAFAGDKLWVGRTHLSWAGGEQLSTVEPTGKLPFDPLEVQVTPSGFKVRFTKPVHYEAANAALWNIRRYTYAYHAEYGSPELEKDFVVPQKVTLSADGLTADLKISELRENFVYDFDMRNLRSRDGESLLNQKAAYTLRKKP
jgi:hypothetical protein